MEIYKQFKIFFVFYGVLTTISTVDGITDLACDFENSFCKMSKDKTADFDWERQKGATLSLETGPTTDHTLQTDEGYYIYIEASVPRKKGDIARLIGPYMECYKSTITFWYHMYGKDIYKLVLYAVGKDGKQKAVWTKTGHQGKKWKKGTIKVTSTVKWRILIEGHRGKSFKGDIALDDISMMCTKPMDTNDETPSLKDLVPTKTSLRTQDDTTTNYQLKKDTTYHPSSAIDSMSTKTGLRTQLDTSTNNPSTKNTLSHSSSIMDSVSSKTSPLTQFDTSTNNSSTKDTLSVSTKTSPLTQFDTSTNSPLTKDTLSASTETSPHAQLKTSTKNPLTKNILSHPSSIMDSVSTETSPRAQDDTTPNDQLTKDTLSTSVTSDKWSSTSSSLPADESSKKRTTTKVSTFFENITTLQTTAIRKCKCPCKQIGDSSVVNITFQQLASIMEETKKELQVNKSQLSSFIRKKISVKDNSPASKTIGAIGAIVLILIGMFLLAIDLLRFCGKV